MRKSRPTPGERFAYHVFSLLVTAAGLYQLVQLLGFGFTFLGAGQ